MTLFETSEWQEFEQAFVDELTNSKNVINIKTEGKTAEMIALEVMARKEAASIAKKALNKAKAKHVKNVEKQRFV